MIKEWLVSVLDEAAVAATLVMVLFWLSRNWIAARLTEGVRLDTERKLHEFKVRLDAAESQVNSVRQAGIEATLQFSAAMVAERIAASKEIWDGINKWKSATMVSTLVSAMNIDYVRESGNSPRTKETVRKLLDSMKYMELMDATNALQRCRPFVTERAWALFMAYHSFHLARILRAFSIAYGDQEFIERIWTMNSELEIVRETAPLQMTQAYEAGSIATTIPFLNFLELELLSELKKSLAGDHSGPDALKQAARIVAAASEIMQEVSKTKFS